MKYLLISLLSLTSISSFASECTTSFLLDDGEGGIIQDEFSINARSVKSKGDCIKLANGGLEDLYYNKYTAKIYLISALLSNSKVMFQASYKDDNSITAATNIKINLDSKFFPVVNDDFSVSLKVGSEVAKNAYTDISCEFFLNGKLKKKNSFSFGLGQYATTFNATGSMSNFISMGVGRMDNNPQFVFLTRMTGPAPMSTSEDYMSAIELSSLEVNKPFELEIGWLLGARKYKAVCVPSTIEGRLVFPD